MAKQTPTREAYVSLFPQIFVSALQKRKPDLKAYLAGNGWLKKGAATLITGMTGIGKSVLIEQMAICLALGLDIFSLIPVRRPVKTLLMEAENDEDILKQDIEAIGKHLNADMKLLDKNLAIHHVPGLPSERFGECLEELLKAHKAEMVFVDPYQSFISNDINLTEPFFRWRNDVDPLIKGRGVGLAMTMHTTKPSKEKKNWNSLESVYMAAGTSAVVNWARTACELIPTGDYGRWLLNFSKSPSRTGMIGEGNAVIRELYIEHSGELTKPYWRVSKLQSGGVVLESTARKIEKLFNAHPKWGYGDFAKALSMSKSGVRHHVGRLREKETAKKTEPKKKKKPRVPASS